MQILMTNTVEGTCEGKWLTAGRILDLSEEASKRLVDSGDATWYLVVESKPRKKA